MQVEGTEELKLTFGNVGDNKCLYVVSSVPYNPGHVILALVKLPYVNYTTHRAALTTEYY